MANIILRGVKGSPLTNDELDFNINEINIELSGKATQADLITLTNNVNASLSVLQSNLEGQIAARIPNSAGSVSNNNLANGSVTPNKISTASAAWSFTGTLSVSGNVTVNNLNGAIITGTSGVFGALTVSGVSNFAQVNSTSFNGPIGANTPSTGVFTTLNATTINVTTLNATTINGFAALALNSTVVTPNASDNSNRIASTAYVQSTGKNSQGVKTVSRSGPSGGANGDIWYQF